MRVWATYEGTSTATLSGDQADDVPVRRATSIVIAVKCMSVSQSDTRTNRSRFEAIADQIFLDLPVTTDARDGNGREIVLAVPGVSAII